MNIFSWLFTENVYREKVQMTFNIFSWLSTENVYGGRVWMTFAIQYLTAAVKLSKALVCVFKILK
jgi:hypothetical protein